MAEEETRAGEGMREAEEGMLADVLAELYHGTLAMHPTENWHDLAARRLSRGSAPHLLAALSTAHMAGMRSEPRAAALAEAFEMLLLPERKASGPCDFPTELAVLVVERETRDAVDARLGGVEYHSAADIVAHAMHVLAWAESNPEGKNLLLRFKLQQGAAAEEAGHLIPAEEVFARAREQVRPGE